MTADSRALFLGAGLHTVLGADIPSNLAALQRPASAPDIVHQGAGTNAMAIPYKLLAGMPLGNPEQRLHNSLHRVIHQACKDAGIEPQQPRLGLFVGSSSFDVAVSEARFQQELLKDTEALAIRDPSFGNLAHSLVATLGLRGPDYSFNTACTASANALMAATRQLAAGVIDYALVVGVELFNNITAQGFSSLGLLTSSVMKPFDASRDGLVLGESVAALVLGSARQRDASHFYLAGGANRSDAHSITSITADGSTVASVMNQALASANCKPEAIAAIKVHGTASLANDEAEAAGMHRVFASLPKVCALKPFIGHTLGACGLTELILFYRALEAGFLIATPGISVEPGELRVALNQQPQFSPSMSNSYLLNYFGFGGNNSALVIRRNGGGGAP